MTATVTPETAHSPRVSDDEPPGESRTTKDEPKPSGGRTAHTGLGVVVVTLVIAAAIMLGFVGYVMALSSLSEARTQHTLFKSFTRTLGQAFAPVGPTKLGAPVAVLDIPAIGMHNAVVVEGTDARTLTRGPGHRRDTPLPGQAGVSVLYGRRAAFGSPFADIDKLQRGDLIQVTTGQGTAKYMVETFGAGARPARVTSDNRLVLVTADGTFLPSSTITVSADLKTTVQPSPGGLPAIGDQERAMRGAGGASALPLLLWGQALLAVAVIATWAWIRWVRWTAFLCFAPVVLAVLWNVYENAASLLPNLY